MYESLVTDIRTLAEGTGDISDSRTYQAVLRQICTSFSISQQDAEVGARLYWYRDADDQNPFCSTPFPKEDSLQEFDCIVNVTLGAPCEFVFQRSDFGDKFCYCCNNGSSVLLGHDVCFRWQRDVKIVDEARSSGLILISIVAKSGVAREEFKLAPMPPPVSCVLKMGGQSDPGASVERPSMRIKILTDLSRLQKISHDDVIIIPSFLCDRDDWSIYYRMLREVRESQARDERNAQWESWHEGSHLLTKNPNGSDTYHHVIDKICDVLAIANRDCRDGNSVGTRFNWYRDGSDWKPFHHDSAAFNAQRAEKQNCTVGISFGASRELAFRHAKTGELLYFPQTNGMLFFFGRDVNIRWQHGINALPADEQDGLGRISIILWGLTTLAVEEAGSPSMLYDSYEGKGKGKGKSKGDGKGTGICRNFQRGFCNFGDRCRYRHVSGHGQYYEQRRGGA
jgi:hypothetical protein